MTRKTFLFRKIPIVFVAASIVCFLCDLNITVNAQEGVKTCAGVEIKSINVATETGRDWPASTKAEIEVDPQTSIAPDGNTRELKVIVYGPILGSAMNSPEVKTDLACSPGGVTLGVTIEHYGDGDTFKNALWRPKITLGLTLSEDVVFQTVWKMRRPDGTEVDRSQTAPYPEQEYPITVTKMLRSVSGQYLEGSEANGQDLPLKAEIKLAQTTVTNNEEFSVATVLRNVSKKEQSLVAWTCSYRAQWTSDNPSIQNPGIQCAQNLRFKIQLKPGGTYERELRVIIKLAAGMERDNSVTFRLGFEDATGYYVPGSKIPLIWSNAVTVSVTR